MKRSDFLKSIALIGIGSYFNGFRLLTEAEAAPSVLQLNTYPNPIPCDGALNLSKVFEYFKLAMLDSDGGRPSPELWPYFFGIVEFEPGQPVPRGEMIHFVDRLVPGLNNTPVTFPMTRAQFYTWMDNYKPPLIYPILPLWYPENGFMGVGGSNTSLYTFSEPQDGWTIDQVNNWGKMKSLELGIFGNVTNGGSTGSTSIIGSGNARARLPTMTHFDLVYLRFGLIRFEDYGACHPEIAPAPPPTNPSVNAGARTFNWTNAPGYTALNNYEYSVNEGEWKTVTAKPQPIGTLSPVPVGQFLLRTRESGYLGPSSAISNPASYPSMPIQVHLWVEVTSANTYIVYGALLDPVPGLISVSGSVRLVNMSSGTNDYSFSLSISIGEYYGTYQNNFASNLNPGGNHQVLSPASVSPSSIEGRTITAIYNSLIPIPS